jgi:hypothetical protein
MRMKEIDPAKKVLCTTPEGSRGRRKGKPKLRWCDKLEDITWVGCINCRIKVQSRQEWWKLFEEVSPTQGCSTNERSRFCSDISFNSDSGALGSSWSLQSRRS